MKSKIAALVCLALPYLLFSHALQGSHFHYIDKPLAPPDTTDTLSLGCAKVLQSTNVARLLKNHIAHNNLQKTTDGYRIEIYSASGTEGKTGAGDTRTAFILKYPDVKVYLFFNQPNYTLRVGDFKDRIAACGFLETIKASYPGAIVVKDKVVK